jgi:hypothetical protein
MISNDMKEISKSIFNKYHSRIIGSLAHTPPRGMGAGVGGGGSSFPCALESPLSLVGRIKKSAMSVLVGVVQQGGGRRGLTRRSFPEGFVFGTASSAYYQVCVLISRPLFVTSLHRVPPCMLVVVASLSLGW